MSYQVLARKWRPGSFADLVGQGHVLQALTNALENDRVHHAFLFTGTRGVGKTTIARILAKCLNCERGLSATPCGECATCAEIDEGRYPDLVEVDAASRARVDETRELLDNVQYAPVRGRYKVYLIDEVHMFSKHSFNALLKTLEEPPPHVKFLLATTDPQRLPITILSRCLQFNLRRLPLAQIAEQLRVIAEVEADACEPGALTLLARAADGSMRDGLSLLDQAIAYGAGALREEEVRAMLGAIEQRHIVGLLEALAAQDAAAMMAVIAELSREVPDFEEVLADLITALGRLAVLQAVPDAPDDEGGLDEALRELAPRIGPELVQLYYQIGLIGRRDLDLAPTARGGFEMVMLRMLAFTPEEAEASSDGTSRPSGAGSSVAPGGASEPAPVPATGAQPAGAQPAGGQPADRRTSAGGIGEWPAVVARLPLGGVARELALNCALVSAGPGRVALSLDPSRGQLLNEGTRRRLREALETALGQSLSLQIEVAPSAGESPADLQARARDARQRAAVRAIESDPTVREICERFEGAVQSRTIEPMRGRET